MPDFSGLPLSTNIMLLIAAAVIIGAAGTRLATIADRLADATGLGEALAGALFLGASTSLPGIITSVTTAANGYAELSASNAIGGIAAQTAFLAIADIAYKEANLEHAAASPANIMQGTLLVTLLALPLLAANSPSITIWGVHPATLVMFGAYVYGIRMVGQARTRPMWRPRQTPETQEDAPDEHHKQENLSRLWLEFLLFAALLAGAGLVVARTGEVIAGRTGLSETAVGALFTAVSTSLPELVTAIAAVRRGALTLAVGDIIGGNAFDTLFLAVADIAYRDGSIYHAVTQRQSFLIALAILMTGILVLGLVRREKRGVANIGFESFLILLLYFGAVIFLFTA